MVADLTGAQGDLSSNLIELRSSANPDPAAISQGEQQLAAILSLKQKLALAGPGSVGKLSAEIAGVIASAASVSRVLQTATASSAAGGVVGLAAASKAAREAVSDFADDYYGKRKFDPYLNFASEEDEREFRKREAQREEDIRKAMAINTPDGDLRAAQLAKEQLLDAGAHGADKSPDYERTLAGITSATDNLQSAMAPREQGTAAAQRLEGVESKQAANDGTEIPADVLAALRQVRTPDADSVGHGLDGKSAAITTDRSAPLRG